MMFLDTPFRTRFFSPFEALRTMQAELERAEQSSLPTLALYKQGDGILLQAELPGLAGEDVALEVDGETLTISGDWPVEPELERARAQHLERPQGHFSRSLRLPFEIDAERVQARLEHGRLEIELRPSACATPVKIPVQSTQTRRNES